MLGQYLVFLMVDYLIPMYLEFFVTVWLHKDTFGTTNSSSLSLSLD